jgi:hypothetical protein
MEKNMNLKDMKIGESMTASDNVRTDSTNIIKKEESSAMDKKSMIDESMKMTKDFAAYQKIHKAEVEKAFVALAHAIDLLGDLNRKAPHPIIKHAYEAAEKAEGWLRQ